MLLPKGIRMANMAKSQRVSHVGSNSQLSPGMQQQNKVFFCLKYSV